MLLFSSRAADLVRRSRFIEFACSEVRCDGDQNFVNALTQAWLHDVKDLILGASAEELLTLGRRWGVRNNLRLFYKHRALRLTTKMCNDTHARRSLNEFINTKPFVYSLGSRIPLLHTFDFISSRFQHFSLHAKQLLEVTRPIRALIIRPGQGIILPWLLGESNALDVTSIDLIATPASGTYERALLSCNVAAATRHSPQVIINQLDEELFSCSFLKDSYSLVALLGNSELSSQDDLTYVLEVSLRAWRSLRPGGIFLLDRESQEGGPFGSVIEDSAANRSVDHFFMVAQDLGAISSSEIYSFLTKST